MNKYESLMNNILKDKNIPLELLLTLSASAVCICVGLTVNSATLIVGGKLLAPFIRPAQGFGFSLATKNKKMAFNFFKQFTIFLLISLIISTIFFKIIPLEENIKHLLNKTSFSYLDILVGSFCGIAAIIGKTKNLSDNILYGVAVAASLMPSVCIMGYGIANNLMSVFLNAGLVFMTHISLISFFAFIGTMIYSKIKK